LQLYYYQPSFAENQPRIIFNDTVSGVRRAHGAQVPPPPNIYKREKMVFRPFAYRRYLLQSLLSDLMEVMVLAVRADKMQQEQHLINTIVEIFWNSVQRR